MSVNDLTASDIYTVSRLNLEARTVLEGGFGDLWIEGELSNLARPASGHIYFSLKDAAAQVRCAMFRSRNAQLGFVPENGLQVLVRARVSLFEARGEFQLIVERMEPAGSGLLQLAFERLKQKLAAEGLFDSVLKQAIPTFPSRIGVITSPSGAAIRDVLSVLHRRCPMLPVIVYPTAVQGAAAAAEIVRAIATANRRAECDVLILTRGGGSLEDLWPFNEEQVARAVFGSRIPIVSGVGHEIDFTIADLAADLRAPTPSASAELVSPDVRALRQDLRSRYERMCHLMRVHLERLGETVDWYERRLPQPRRLINERSATIRQLHKRLSLAVAVTLQRHGHRLAAMRGRLYTQHPGNRIRALQARSAQLAIRLRNAWSHDVTKRRSGLAALTRALHAISPLATLERGYAIIHNRRDGSIARSAAQFKTGDQVTAKLHVGTLDMTVDKTHE